MEFVMDINEARILKEKVKPVAESLNYAVGITGSGQMGYRIAVRTQGNGGTEEEFLEALNKVGVTIDKCSADFLETSRPIAELG
jgi:hypothetical protein